MGFVEEWHVQKPTTHIYVIKYMIQVWAFFFSPEDICAEITHYISVVPKRQHQLLSVTHSAFD